jgi:DNA-binding GntR family transcriptional regulator
VGSVRWPSALTVGFSYSGRVLQVKFGETVEDPRVSQSLSDQAYRTLKNLIIDLELSPGSLVTERELIDAADVSRASLRVAVQRLIQERWISSLARRGFVISSLTLKDANELFELRTLLEPHAVFLAAGKLTADDHAPLLNRIAKGYDLADSDSLKEYLRASSAFLLSFAYAAGVDRLTRILEDLSETRQRYARLTFETYSLADVALEQYRTLSRLVCSGDAENARQYSMTYLSGARQNLISALALRPEVVSKGLGMEQLDEFQRPRKRSTKAAPR